MNLTKEQLAKIKDLTKEDLMAALERAGYSDNGIFIASKFVGMRSTDGKGPLNSAIYAVCAKSEESDEAPEIFHLFVEYNRDGELIADF